MNPDTRACVAYAALRLIAQRSASVIYDCSRCRYISIDGNVSGNGMQLYDYSRNARIIGDGSDGQYKLYDCEKACQIDLRIKGKHYEGFDCNSLTRFSGTVAGDATSLYDHTDAGFFDYTL
ncbi:MAG TPA: hypothetical protein VMH83_16010 [Candidatus Acidoferrum sp.]|nr:hypothetical protein [Candidatus Acidoferrum sp.]